MRNIVNYLADAGDEIASRSKGPIKDMRKQGNRMLDQASHQLHDGLEYVEDHAQAVKDALSNYVNAKPVTSAAIGLGLLYVASRLLRRF